MGEANTDFWALGNPTRDLGSGQYDVGRTLAPAVAGSAQFGFLEWKPKTANMPAKRPACSALSMLYELWDLGIVSMKKLGAKYQEINRVFIYFCYYRLLYSSVSQYWVYDEAGNDAIYKCVEVFTHEQGSLRVMMTLTQACYNFSPWSYRSSVTEPHGSQRKIRQLEMD
jgi:hypothetical protein